MSIPPEMKPRSKRATINLRGFSELENIVLAMICFGYETGYSLIQEMKRARGGRWSTRSGAVYRILRKLEKLGYIQSKTKKYGSRESLIVSATEKGHSYVKNWVESPMPFSEIAMLSDPMRSRAYFLSTLKPKERLDVVRFWISENASFIRSLQKDVDSTFWLGRKDDPFKLAAYRELMQLASARGRWLQEVEELCKSSLTNE